MSIQLDSNIRQTYGRLRSMLMFLLCTVLLACGSLAAAEGVSPQDVDAFADRLIAAVDDSDIASFNELIDWNGILKEVCRLPESEKLDKARKDFKVEFRKATKTKDSICGAIIGTVELGGDYAKVHTGTENGRPFALFRLILPDNGGVNFHKYFLI